MIGDNSSYVTACKEVVHLGKGLYNGASLAFLCIQVLLQLGEIGAE